MEGESNKLQGRRFSPTWDITVTTEKLGTILWNNFNINSSFFCTVDINTVTQLHSESSNDCLSNNAEFYINTHCGYSPINFDLLWQTGRFYNCTRNFQAVNKSQWLGKKGTMQESNEWISFLVNELRCSVCTRLIRAGESGKLKWQHSKFSITLNVSFKRPQKSLTHVNFTSLCAILFHSPSANFDSSTRPGGWSTFKIAYLIWYWLGLQNKTLLPLLIHRFPVIFFLQNDCSH